MNLYISQTGYAFDGCWQSIPKLPGLYKENEKHWIIVGAALVDVIIHKDYKNIDVWVDSDIESEFNSGKCKTLISQNICKQIKEIIATHHAIVRMFKTDGLTLQTAIDKLKRV